MSTTTTTKGKTMITLVNPETGQTAYFADHEIHTIASIIYSSASAWYSKGNGNVGALDSELADRFANLMRQGE